MRTLALFILSCLTVSAQVGKTPAFRAASVPPHVVSGPTNTTAGLVNWWKFDENAGTNAADSAGSANGTFTGSPVWVAGKINSALHFLSTPAYVTLSTNTLNGWAGAFTFSAWVWPTNKNGGGTIIYDSDNDSSAGYFLNLESGQAVSFTVTHSITDVKVTTSDQALPTNGWTHFLCTWGGGTTAATDMHVFTNGLETGYSFSQDGSGVHSANTTINHFIGNWPDFGTIEGNMDDLRLWNRVLSQGEITNMFQWRGQP